MNEPLFDSLTAVSAFFAIAAVLTLRPADPPPTNVDRIKQRHVVGLVLLVLSVAALLFRWIDCLMTVPVELRSGAYGRVKTGTDYPILLNFETIKHALLTIICGFGIVAAILSVTVVTVADRVKSFLAVAACGTIALMIAAAWEWALLWITLLAFGCWAVLRITQRIAKTAESTIEMPDEAPREPGLIMLAAASVLVLLLGTWQHVVKNESQRNTRSQRYSAWPRATALANAWERSGWVVKSDENNPKKPDRASSELVTTLASREQHIAWGLATMMLVVAGVAWRQSKDLPKEQPHEC